MSSVAFLHYHLHPGGYERLLVNVLNELASGSRPPILILLRREGAFLGLLRDGVEVVELGARLRYAVPRLIRLVRKRGIRVLCTGHTHINLLALAAGLRCRGLEAVIGEHTPLSLAVREMRRPRLTLWAMRRLYPRAHSLVVPVPQLGADIARVLDRPGLPVRLLHNPVLGPDTDAEAREEPPIVWPRRPVAVAAGRLVRAKGFDVLLRAIARTPDLSLLILGQGPEEEALSRLAEDLRITPRVRFCGPIANPLPFFRRADVVVSASRRESFGNVLIEAMYCGTPVVATDCWEGSGFVVRDGAAGLLVPPDDVEALAAALGRVCSDKEVAMELAAAGAEWSRQFSYAAAVPGYARLIESALGG